MRAVIVAALVTAVALHIGSALANQKRKYQDTNSQYNNLATQVFNQLDFSSSSNSANPSQFAKYYGDYGAGKRFSRGVYILPQGGGGRGRRGGRGRGDIGTVTHDRRGCVFSAPCLPPAPPPASQPARLAPHPHQPASDSPPAAPNSPQLAPHPPQLAPHPPQLAPHPPQPASDSPPAALHAPPNGSPSDLATHPLPQLLRYLPNLPGIDQFFYSAGVMDETRLRIPPQLSIRFSDYVIRNRILWRQPRSLFYYALGRQHAGGDRVPRILKLYIKYQVRNLPDDTREVILRLVDPPNYPQGMTGDSPMSD